MSFSITPGLYVHVLKSEQLTGVGFPLPPCLPHAWQQVPFRAKLSRQPEKMLLRCWFSQAHQSISGKTNFATRSLESVWSSVLTVMAPDPYPSRT